MKVSINSPSGEGGGTDTKFSWLDLSPINVSINSPSGEGGGAMQKEQPFDTEQSFH